MSSTYNIGKQSCMSSLSCHEDIQFVPCSAQLGMTFILLIKIKVPTSVCILMLISGVNTTSGCFKQEKIV